MVSPLFPFPCCLFFACLVCVCACVRAPAAPCACVRGCVVVLRWLLPSPSPSFLRFVGACVASLSLCPLLCLLFFLLHPTRCLAFSFPDAENNIHHHQPQPTALSPSRNKIISPISPLSRPPPSLASLWLLRFLLLWLLLLTLPVLFRITHTVVFFIIAPVSI